MATGVELKRIPAGGGPEALLAGGSQYTYSTVYHGRRSPSVGRWKLEVGTGHLIHERGITDHELPFVKRGGTDCPWHHGVDYLDCSEGEYDSAL